MDEITDYEEDAAPVITYSIAADMASSGIPVPSHLAKESAEQSSTLLSRFIEALTNIFKSNSNAQSDMNPNNQEQQQGQQQEQLTPETTAQEQSGQQANTQESVEAQHQAALAAKDQEIASLKAHVEALKKAPGASTSHVVEDEKKENKKNQSHAEDYCDTYNKAKALFTALG